MGGVLALEGISISEAEIQAVKKSIATDMSKEPRRVVSQYDL